MNSKVNLWSGLILGILLIPRDSWSGTIETTLLSLPKRMYLAYQVVPSERKSFQNKEFAVEIDCWCSGVKFERLDSASLKLSNPCTKFGQVDSDGGRVLRVEEVVVENRVVKILARNISPEYPDSLFEISLEKRSPGIYRTNLRPDMETVPLFPYEENELFFIDSRKTNHYMVNHADCEGFQG